MNAHDDARVINAGRYCTFTVSGQLLGLSVAQVQEVLRSHSATRVPRAPETVNGLINLRGDIVTTFDLRRRLGIDRAVESGRERDEPSMHVIVRTDDGVTSVLVDQVRDVVEIHPADIEPVPTNAPRTLREVAMGVVQQERDLLVLLDAHRMLDLSTNNTPPNTKKPNNSQQDRGGHQ